MKNVRTSHISGSRKPARQHQFLSTQLSVKSGFHQQVIAKSGVVAT